MRRLVIMRGVPGSGKSTEARAIRDDATRLGFTAAVHSTDIYFTTKGVYAFDPARLATNHEKNKRAAHRSMLSGINVVVIDNTNTTEGEYGDYVAMALDLGYSVEFREPATQWWADAVATLKEGRSPADVDQHADILASRCSHGVPEYIIAEMLHRYEIMP